MLHLLYVVFFPHIDWPLISAFWKKWIMRTWVFCCQLTPARSARQVLTLWFIAFGNMQWDHFPICTDKSLLSCLAVSLNPADLFNQERWGRTRCQDVRWFTGSLAFRAPFVLPLTLSSEFTVVGHCWPNAATSRSKAIKTSLHMFYRWYSLTFCFKHALPCLCLGYITATDFFLFFLSLVWFLRDGAPAVMFWSFWQFEKAPECKQERRVWYQGFFLFVFDVRLLMQTHIPAVCKSFYPHVIITHEEFDIHLCKVAEKGRLWLAKEKWKGW